MGEAVLVQAEHADGGGGVAATDDGEGAVVRGGVDDGLGDALGALGERGHLEDTHRAVPEDGLGGGEDVGELLDGLRADVRGQPALRDLVEGDDLVLGVGGELGGGHEVHREDDLVAETLEEVLAGVDHLLLQQGLLGVVALGVEEGVAHAATDDDLVGLAGQSLDDAQLVGDLGAAEDDDVRGLRVGGGLLQDGDLLLHQVAGVGRETLGDVVHGGLRTVDDAEAVGDEGTVVRGQGGELVGEGAALGLVLGGLAGVETHVLEEQDVALGQAVGALVGVLTGDVAGEGDVLAECLGEGLGDRGQGVLRVDLALRAAQVGHDDDLRATLDERLEGGQGGGDAARVGDLTGVVERDVEVGADEDVAAVDALVEQVLQSLHGHGCLLDFCLQMRKGRLI